jgi:hypothetical protein
MHKNATKCNKTQSKWCINKHVASKIIDTFETYQLFGVVTKLASINLRKLVLSPIGSINLGFILREDLLLCSSYLSLGVPNWEVIYTLSSNFFGVVAGEKEDFCKGSLSLPIFYFVIVLLYFIFACIFLSKIQKKLVPL